MHKIVFVTCPDQKTSDNIAETLLEKNLAACVNSTGVKSSYWWKGKIQKNKEVLMIIKTTKKNLKKLEKTIKSLHPYEVCEIVSFDIKGSTEYLKWIDDSVK
jgi:periplasmic divalent cation tolerance protein